MTIFSCNSLSVNLLDYVVEADSVNSFRAAFRPITSSIKCTEHARIFWPTSIIIFTLKMLLTCESVITVDMVQRLLCYEVTAGLHSPLYVQCPPVSGTQALSLLSQCSKMVCRSSRVLARRQPPRRSVTTSPHKKHISFQSNTSVTERSCLSG